MSSIIALEEYNKAKEHKEKFLKARNSKIDFTSKSHYEKAMKYYKEAANAGNVDAMYDLAIIASQHELLQYSYKFDSNVFKDNNQFRTNTIYWLKKAAENNHEEAISWLSYCYRWHIKDNQQRLTYLLKKYENGFTYDFKEMIDVYASVNVKEAIQFINKYIQENHIQLETWYYTIDLINLYKKINQKDEVDKYYRFIVEKGKYNYENREAFLYVASDYYLKKDYGNAIKVYKKCHEVNKLMKMAENNEGIHPQEFFEYVKENKYSLPLSLCYLKGFGTEKNEKGGFVLLKSYYDSLKNSKYLIGAKYQKSNIPASILVPLAECYYFGRGVQVDLKEALRLFLEAEKQSDIVNYDILYAICWCYFHTKDYSNAFNRLTKYVSRDGIVANWAYYLLGWCYQSGNGTSINHKKAFEYYLKGANKKHADACCAVGNCYYNGRGVEKDYKRALEYYNYGYEINKNMHCAFNIGLCYEQGNGTLKNLVKAYEWYKIAYDLKYEPALKKLEELEIPYQRAKKEKEEKEKIEDLTKQIFEKIEELKGNKKQSITITNESDGNAKEKLNELIGLDSVKKEIQELENFIKVMNMRKSRGLPVTEISKHMVFTGNPGTGKTTVARIVAQIYKENGILEKGQLVETDREGLVGQYIGETGKKTRQVIESAMGGVLFIDEAYSLIPKDNSRDFGPEAVATLLKMMEDHKNDFVVIVAGYKDEMEHFIDSNPGLKSRFTSYINFEDYTPEQMQEIFELKASKDMFKINDQAKSALNELWKESSKYRNLGNGRCVRNVYEKVQRLQSNRIIKYNLTSDEDFIMILKEDIPKAEDIFK